MNKHVSKIIFICHVIFFQIWVLRFCILLFHLTLNYDRTVILESCMLYVVFSNFSDTLRFFILLLRLMLNYDRTVIWLRFRLIKTFFCCCNFWTFWDFAHFQHEYFEWNHWKNEVRWSLQGLFHLACQVTIRRPILFSDFFLLLLSLLW